MIDEIHASDDRSLEAMRQVFAKYESELLT